MEFLKNNNRFSFLYGGEDTFSQKFTKSVEEKGNEIITTYLFDDGLKITNVAKKYPEYDAYEWVNYFENTGDKNTKLISELWDAVCEVSIGEADEFKWTARFPDIDNLTRIYNPKGSECSDEDFSFDVRKLRENAYPNAFYLGEKKCYSAEDGRSSSGSSAPFFNVQNKEKGVVVGIGWTGQWACEFLRKEDTVEIKSGIKDTAFILYPNERIRTSSVVIMSYEGDFFDGQNKWRRLLREEFSPITKQGGYAILSANVWGGMKSELVLKRIEKLDEYKIPVEYVWMDAGWYGIDTQPTPDEFEGDWPKYTGDWRISKHIHPSGMMDIVEKLKESNKKFLLWFEPERVHDGTLITKEHPEYLMSSKVDDSFLLDLGNEDAFNYCLETLTDMIEKLNISCYRQDFNFNPLDIWAKEDTDDRRGITQIKHINDLYRLWDSLLERFPDLVIDNCASGGRRIDVETIKRSVPLWRSDVQCPLNYTAELSQVQQMYYPLWVPYSANGAGRECNLYRWRSAYSSGLSFGTFYSARDNYINDADVMNWCRERVEEYIKLREYFNGDMYHLTQPTMDFTAWNATEWNRPDEKDGMIQVFKHKNSPYKTASFAVRGIDKDKNYLFTDIDGGEFEMSGKELAEKGFSVTIEEQPTAKIYIYKQI